MTSVPNGAPRLVTPSEASEHFGITRDQIYQYVSRRSIKRYPGANKRSFTVDLIELGSHLEKKDKLQTVEDLRRRTKRCTACQEVKPGTEFHVNTKRNGRVWLAGRCGKCSYSIQSEALRRSPERLARRKEYAKAHHTNYMPQYWHEKQGQTLENASNKGKQWNGAELEIVMREDLTAMEKAKMLNRTLHAVYSAIHKCRDDPRKQSLAGVAR